MAEIADVLEERGGRYGDFMAQSYITMQLKDVVRCRKGWEKLCSDQQEAIEMILVKIARILNGDPNYIDNWDDIQGYAALVSQRLAKEQGK